MSYVKSNHRHYPGYMAIKMKKFTLTILFVLLASPAWATTYFLAPASGGGNDSNNGTSASTPWLSPNHPVNCGDTITATPSATYSASNFGAGKWGTVTCPAGNNVAWLECATFDACKISSSSSNGMQISSSFWGVQGWEITTSSNANITCFLVTPPSSSVIHHVVFANDIANGCENGGFSANYNGSTGADYIAYVGDIAYNAASGGSDCASGFNIVNPSNKDTAAGTHSYIAGNFSWSNVDPSGCTDGEGIILDSIFTNGYTQQIYVSNNLIIGNGGRGIEVLKNNNASAAIIYIEQNTTWNDEIDNTETPGGASARYSCFKIRTPRFRETSRSPITRMVHKASPITPIYATPVTLRIPHPAMMPSAPPGTTISQNLGADSRSVQMQQQIPVSPVLRSLALQAADRLQVFPIAWPR